MSNYVGDFAPGSLVVIAFTTVAAATGAPTALAGAATAASYKLAGTSGATAGVTLALSFASTTGSNVISIDTSADSTFYAAGNDYAVTLTSGSVSGTAVLGYQVGHFSLNNRGIRANVIQVNGVAAATSSAQLGVNVVNLAGFAVAAASGIAQVNLTQWEGIAPNALVAGKVDANASLTGVTSSAQFGVNLVTIGGAPVATSSAQLGVNVVNLSGFTVAAASGIAQVNLTQWEGIAPNALISGKVDANASLAGITSSAQFGVNLVTIGGAPVATSSAQLGVNLVTVNGAAAATSSAQLGVNVVNLAGFAVAAASGIGQVSAVQWQGIAPAPLTTTLLVQTAQSGNIAGSVGSVVGAVGSVTGAVGSVTGAVGSVTARVTANTDQIAGATVNALISGRVDASVGQVQTNGIGPAAFVAGALGTTTFASQFLTSALIDTTYSNAVADALLDRTNAIETGITPRKALRYEVAAAAGALSGAGTTQVNIWGAGVATTRITAVTDQSGNRASVTLA